MRFKILPGLLAVFVLFFLLETGCTKLDTTSLGTDLIPAVDNINTFADTLAVITTQGYFVDSTIVGRENFHALGHINTDPLFGKTTANIFVQLKPSYYPFSLSPGDTLIGLDSVVLGLSYQGLWGDTVLPQHIEVRKINDVGFSNSATKGRPVSYAPNYTNLLGSATIDVRSLRLKKFIRNGKDSVTNQIRVKLTDPLYNDMLFTSDTTLGIVNNNFRNDSLFRKAFNGLAILGDNVIGNGLMYINLADVKTRVEIHFRKKSKAGIIDTVFTSLFLAGTAGQLFPSATANNIIRDRNGTPSATPNPGLNYIQTSPGTFLNVTVPGLNLFKDTNRIIHRATLVVNEISNDPSYDEKFTAPAFLYVDLKDTSSIPGVDKFKPVYKDLNPNLFYNPDDLNSYYPNIVDNTYFGGSLKNKNEISIGDYVSYSLNLSRYIQRMVDIKGINYPLRLYAPFAVKYPQYNLRQIDYANQIAFGRVQVASGSYPDARLRMKMVVIWSKVQK